MRRKLRIENILIRTPKETLEPRVNALAKVGLEPQKEYRFRKWLKTFGAGIRKARIGEEIP